MPFAVGAAITAGAGLIGSSMQSKAVQSGQDAAIAAQQEQQAQTRADLLPWMTTGQNALGPTAALAGAGTPEEQMAAMAGFYTSPGYRFRLGEGLRTIGAGQAASGAFNSGETLKAEQKYGEGLASSEFDKYYNRLFDLSKLGESAGAGVGDVGQRAAAGEAQTALSGAGAQASIYGDQAKTIGSALGGLVSNPKIQSIFSPPPQSNISPQTNQLASMPVGSWFTS